MRGFFIITIYSTIMSLIESVYQTYLTSTGVNTDTRSISKGQIYVALKGENFNGNLFAKDALQNGAVLAVVDEAGEWNDDRIIVVENSLEFLQNLSAYHRKQLKTIIIGITGSNGKTTTKELLFAVLSAKYKTQATLGNLNNHIGVPLTLLAIKPETEIAIVEMGANHIGEIEAYCQWAKPNVGIITNIGKAHLEGFGSLEGVVRAKSELYQSVMPDGGLIVYNEDDSILRRLLEVYVNKKSYSLRGNSPFINGEIEREGVALCMEVLNQKIRTQLFGAHNAANVMCALAVARNFEIDMLTCQKALESYYPDNNRSQIKTIGENTFVLDAYNANPSSMSVTLHEFAQVKGAKLTCILGDMLEVGEDSITEHQQIIKLCQQLCLEEVVLVGNIFGSCEYGNYLHFNNSNEAAFWYKSAQIKNHFILIKGSRGTRLEKILQV